jgi:exopolyphosphatase/guanosine-5'-triphosphate,3'-diphosphate pyrophosphatase
MHRRDLRKALTTLATLPVAERDQLPGISAPRAAQSLAGAAVGHTAMKLMGLRTVTVCPWAIREGVLLRYMEDGAGWWTDLTQDEATLAPAGASRVTASWSVDAAVPARSRTR